MNFRILDLYCCEGGASEGYRRAGLQVAGVDLWPRKRYPFRGYACDAIEFLARIDLSDFDAIHASPPCPRYSIATRARPGLSATHPDLIGPTREAMNATGLPWVMENVPGSPLIDPVTLCGSMFGLRLNGGYLRRHRKFEASFPLPEPPPHEHIGECLGVYGHGVNSRGSFGHSLNAADARAIMDMPWASRDGLSQAVPPAYTEWVGRALIAHLLEVTPEA